jgi:hypothetical protein
LAKAVDAWDRLYLLRGGLREKFDDVLSKLSSAKSYPNEYLGSSPSDENKKNLIDYINVIDAHIKSQAANHLKSETEALNAKINMEKVLKRDSE